MKNRTVIILLFTFALLTFTGCGIYKTIANLSRLQFKLGEVNDFRVHGISVSQKSKLSDFSAMDVLKLTSAVAQGTLPVSFTLYVDALNPNDGKGGYPKTEATLKSFPWRLLIDDKETISGNIGSPISVPGTGEAIAIPFQLQLDLVKFFGEKGYEGVINLALQLGGYGGSTSKLKLVAKPTISSPLGDITYPGELTIIDKEFTK